MIARKKAAAPLVPTTRGGFAKAVGVNIIAVYPDVGA